MAERLVNVDRDTPMLLPVDLRQWVPENDLVHFVISGVDSMNLSAVSVNTRGSGSKQYPPRMMLALLIYCYANGVFGSRRIERATYGRRSRVSAFFSYLNTITVTFSPLAPSP
jgi:transposase